VRRILPRNYTILYVSVSDVNSRQKLHNLGHCWYQNLYAGETDFRHKGFNFVWWDNILDTGQANYGHKFLETVYTKIWRQVRQILNNNFTILNIGNVNIWHRLRNLGHCWYKYLDTGETYFRNKFYNFVLWFFVNIGRRLGKFWTDYTILGTVDMKIWTQDTF
jgi:hypothetical protein